MIETQQRARVLVIDDRVEMAEMISDVLVERGFDAVAQSCGRSALERLRRERFDAVVTDLRMPQVDGLTVLAVSRELDPTRPVIVMTGHVALTSALTAIDRGAYRYLTKPFRIGALAELLKKALVESKTR